jgi:hypothetical protein
VPLKATQGYLDSHDVTYVKVCIVRHAPHEFVGKVIRFRAMYKSDHMFYAFISDSACSKQKTINVAAQIRTHGDNSVTRFFKDENERCNKNKAIVCPIVADMDVEALVSQTSDGSLLVEFKRVMRYRFLSN